MNKLFRMAEISSVACVILISGGSSVWLLAQTYQDKGKDQKQSPNFTGGTVTTVEENSKGAIAHFRFDKGARTKWHSHEGGQIILVEEGVGRHQIKGGPVVELKANETVYAQPGVVHWHGAAPDKGGVQFNISRGGITWLEEVTDKEFSAPVKR
jgi:4-carboxymuconolactone decarboxylase